MRIWRLAVAAVAVALAVGTALLAIDVRSWHDTFRADDLRFGMQPGAPPDWQAATLLPAGVSRRLLAVDDDRELRRALASFAAVERARQASQSGFVRQHLRADAQAALAEVASASPQVEASQAADLLGVLVFSDAASTGPNAATPVERSLGAFQHAVRLDRANGDAAYNLELLLRLLEEHGIRTGPNPAPGPRATGKRGAGAGRPGRGY